MQSLKQSLKKLESSEEFRIYKKQNPKTYLASFFIMPDKDGMGDWQIDFYNPDTHKIKTFIIAETLQEKPADEIFQKEKKQVERLDINNVKFGFDKLMDLINQKQKSAKKIIVLQTADKKEIWNASCITSSFQLINMKIDAKTGKIISEKSDSLLSFKK